MQNIDWTAITAPKSKYPTPGGYAAKILSVEDNEEKQYLRITWDYADGDYKGANQDTYDLYGFYPATFVRSYKPKALYFFKRFKEAVEASNRNFTFVNNPQSLVGKFIGVVVGEEEYRKQSGEVAKRLYVAETVSGADIRAGKFTVPELKKLPVEQVTLNAYGINPVQTQDAFPVLGGDDDGLPF